ncbi:hypothetical protein V1499_22945 (plasmid) [Neobacillus sp. SCS-31]|uniref:hypothetical protein n=1 Tax=Neobacillus oceani TaxID=3115292 RepID=UPI003906AF7A
MYITVQIDYKSKWNNLSQAGSFHLRNKKPEELAFEWWMVIKKDAFEPQLEKVTINGDTDITDLVKAMENIPYPPDLLPF